MSFFELGSGKTLLRSVLVFIILVTIPFYGLGILLLATSTGEAEDDLLTTATVTPLGADITETATATITPTRLVTATPQQGPVEPTPFQFVPPTRLPSATPTTIVFPTDTPAPTLTPGIDSDGDGLLDQNDACPNQSGPASNNGCPRPITATPTPTRTPLPPATNTPLPTSTPPATNTPLPTATPQPTSTPLPTNTPLPTSTPQPTSTPLPTSTPAATQEAGT